nr:F-box/FBD/LRR-repeat protein At1g13570-like [Ipomoea batatas]
MAQPQRDASKDLISHLPLEIKDRILERLPTRDAARTTLLSTHWNDVWLQHGRLAFDLDFFPRFRESKGHSLVPYVKIITDILIQRVRPVKKFSLQIEYLGLLDPKLEQSDLDQWFLFLSRNGVEELDFSQGDSESQFKLPLCIVSCPTIKQLRLWGVDFDFPLNAPFRMQLSSVSNGDGGTWNVLLDKDGTLDCFSFSMAQRRRINTLPDSSSDRISRLPVEIKDRILECLPTRDAAKTALLSTHWNDVWLQHGRLAFDMNFWRYDSGEFKGYSRVPCFEVITYILLQRVLPVKKFSLDIYPKLEQSHLDQWLFFLSRNGVEELCLSHGGEDGFTVIKFLRELLCFPRASPKAQIAIKGKDPSRAKIMF